MKIHRFFTTVIYIYIYTFKVSKTYNRIVHEYKCLFLAFILLQIERESGKQNLGVKEKCPKVTYLIFLTGFHWRIFLLSRANRLCTVFNTGLKDLGSFVSQLVFLSLARSKMAIVRLPRDLLKNSPFCALLPLRGREPHFRFGVPANHLASLSFPFRCPATQGHLGANICVTHILS